ncbi:reverse transcriptase [Pectobacterium punjabense]|uniref:Reverse transcriptase n=1 Tax=Pectobacterium punjabense TaxID=2108399 RepID=A0ABX6L997_9GAMM|nr:reverse transcriptase domain-containing protein [Pectobacterium punjabense]MBS4429712.1 reverse transcriptase [Pectobacterium punjabense]PTA64147.1 reverse transcriptase [Pectobacterium punjabense]QJA22192.1 reverse transcriptase [Pectobacterium punjabense]
MNAARKFKGKFSIRNLKSIYQNKIKSSGAIGIDRVRPSSLEKKLNDELELISKKVNAGIYKFTAYKEKLISKGANSNPRQISIPTARDRITLRALCECLSDVFPEARLKLPHTVMDSLKEALHEKKFTEYAKIDLKSFYPSIEHSLIEHAIKSRIRKKEFRSLIMSALAVPTVNEFKGSKHSMPNTKGVPQGLAISNILAEISLGKLDNELSSDPNIWFKRYVDDILILTTSGQASIVAENVIRKLESIELKPHPLNEENSKSVVGVIGTPFSFLGYQIIGEELLIKRDSILRFESSLAKIFTAYRHALSQAKNKRDKEKAIAYCKWKLNLRITGCIFGGKRLGWVSYFSQISSTAQLRAVNHTVTKFIKRFGLGDDIKAKSLIKTFYEINRGVAFTSRYIPNFDNLTIEQKREVVSMWIGREAANKLRDSEVERKFNYKITSAVKELEEDISGIS